MEDRGNKWILFAAVALILILGYAFFSSSSKTNQNTNTAAPVAQGTPAPPGAIAISIVSSNTKQDWLHNAVRVFNEASKSDKNLQVGGKPVFVEIIQEMIDGKPVDYRSGTIVSDTLGGKIKPIVISPGEESWLAKFSAEWRVRHNSSAISGDSPVLVRTPLVVAMPESRAKALGCWPKSGPNCTWERFRTLAVNPDGWKMFGHPEWGKFKFGYGYYNQSNSGTLGLTTMCLVGAKKVKGIKAQDVSIESGCGKMMADIEMAKVHSGKSDVWLLGKMRTGGPEYLDAVITYESNVILENTKHAKVLREPLVSVYPQDGTVVVGHPFAILDGAPWVTTEQVAAAKIFGKFLLSDKQQEEVLALGLRPADSKTKLGPPIDPSFGANPDTKLTLVDLPDVTVSDRIGEVWHRVKKMAVVVMLFDKSDSMAGERISAAIKGAITFVDNMENRDYLIWLPFDSKIYGGVAGTKAQIGEQLKSDIRGISAGGSTALYDAALRGLELIEPLRRQYKDRVRYGMIILSDGEDTSSRRELSDIESKLRPTENDPHGVQVHAICISCSERHQGVMRKIAGAAHGKMWPSKTAEGTVSAWRDIAVHY